MMLRFAAAFTVAALCASPCAAQSRPETEPNRFNLQNSVRRAWQADAQGLMELVNAEHPRGADRCWSRKMHVTDRLDCFQRLVERHFLRVAIARSAPLQSWCTDDKDPGHCLDSLAAQEVEAWRYKRMNATLASGPAPARPSASQ